MNFLLGQKNLDHWSAKKRGKKLIKLLLIAISKKKIQTITYNSTKYRRRWI